MAMLALLLLVVSVLALFFSTTLHVLCALGFFVAILLHNWTSRGFYAKFFSAQATGRNTTELLLIVLLALSCLLLFASGLLMFCGILMPWLWLHRAATALVVLLCLWHMKKEWG